MASSCLDSYEPINVLKPVADNVWIVDGPIVRMKYPGIGLFSLPFSTRMTVIRLQDRRLWLHSPTAADPELVSAVAALGEIGFLVAPNRLHHEWLPDWAALFPDAELHAAPGVAEAAGDFPGQFAVLRPDAPDGWSGEIDQAALRGRFMTEIVFRHQASNSVIVTDLIESFERGKVRCRSLWWLMRLGGVGEPGGTPRDLRATFPRHDEALRAAAREIASWNANRVILAHGACIESRAAERMRKALQWLL